MCYDVIFKAVFTGEENILAKMVSDITGITYEILEDNVILETNELPISTKNEKAKRCDFILKIGKDNVINLEINSSHYGGLIIKNLSYLFQLFSTLSKRVEEYSENMLAIQINLNCYDKNSNKSLAKYILQEEETHQLYTKNISIFNLNVVKCYELYYNLDNKENISNYIRWGALLYNRDLKKIPDIVGNIMTNKERDRIMSKLDKLTREDLFYTEEEALEWAEWERRSRETEAINRGLAKGMQEGMEKGIAEGKEKNY